MTATPEVGSVRLVSSNQTISIPFYVSDVLGAFVTWNLNGVPGSTSQNFINVPFTGVIQDIAIATGLAVTTIGVVQINDQNTGNSVVWANQVNTLSNRFQPNILVTKGQKLTILQQ